MSGCWHRACSSSGLQLVQGAAMALRIRFPESLSGHQLKSRILLGLLIAFVAAAVIGISIFGYFYHKYEGIVDERLKQPIFASTAQIYAAPREVRPGQKLP